VEEKQAALEAHETPAFLSSEVTAKLEPIEKEVRRLIKKPKPKPPKAKKEKNATNGTANASSANASEPAGGENGTASDAGGEEDLSPHDEL